MSHLWASVAQESAPSSPAASGASDGARARPQPEGAVDVHPGPRPRARGDDRRGRVEGAGVDVAGLQADDRALVERGQRVGAHAPLAVHRHPHDALAAEAEHPERLEQAHVHLVAHDHAQRRRAEQPLRLDVPALAREQRVARGGEAAEVRHRGAGDEADAGAGREREHVEQPA